MLGFELLRSGREGGERPKREALCRADVPSLLHIQFIDQDEAVASLCNARPSPGMRKDSERSVSSLLSQFRQLRVFGKRCNNFCTGI